MNKTFLLIATLATAALVGCSKNEPAAAAPAAVAGPRTVEITAGDNMKYNIASIEAAPGEEIKVILTNIGTQPKEVMGHNWVLLKAGTDVNAYAAAAMTAKDTDYQPAALAGQVLAHIPLLGPKKSAEVVFKAPTEKGEYPFLCSFPAHFQVGMKGVLVVK